MIARMTYDDKKIRLCTRHYEDPPHGLGALGEMTDPRDMGCAVCDATRRAEHLLEEGLHVAPRDQGQAVVVARNIEEQKVLILDRADMSLRIRLHGCDVWATADRGDLHPAHQRLLEALY